MTVHQSEARWHIVFSGRVQHVGFRYTALYICRSLSLTGWVKNLSDGNVEMEIQGPLASLRNFYVQIKAQSHIFIENADINSIAVFENEHKFIIC